MAERQYIGARYVPKFFNGSNGSEWVSNTQYEALTIVTRNGNSYTSKIPVPASVGAPESNPDYWVSTGIYNQQIEVYRQEVETYVGLVSPLDTEFGDIEIIGGAIRKTADGWSILSGSGHMPKHISSVAERLDGGLDLNFDKTYTNVGTLCITPDETLTR